MSDTATARQRPSWLRKLLRPPALFRASGKPIVSLPVTCAAMGALVLALVIWRVDVVRLLPQTAALYKLAGLEINLRGLMFKDVKITTETVEGKPVLVIEGAITGEARKPVELPRLRFSVRDAQGAENLRLEHGAGAARAETGRAGLVQVAAGFATAGRAPDRCALLQQAGPLRR